MYSVPIKCKDYADFERAVKVAEDLNKLNDTFKLEVILSSGSLDPEDDEIRWCDVNCPSQAKIQHFLEIGLKLDKQSEELERTFKLESAPLALPSTTTPSYGGLTPLGNAGGMDLYSFFGPPSEEELELLDLLKQKLQETKRKYNDNTGEA